MYGFKPGEYEITKAKKKRSLDANAYLWVLCSKIAAAVGISKEEVYRRAIRDGEQFTPMPIKAEAVEDFSRIWQGHGTGWFIDVADGSKIPGYKLVLAYHGSSVYDTKSMAQLIDRVIDEAKTLDIETLTPEEIERMKLEW